MRKVQNTLNFQALQKLNDFLVLPLILVLESAKKEGKAVTDSSAFKGLEKDKSHALSVALRQVVDKNNTTLEQGCVELLTALPIDASTIRMYFEKSQGGRPLTVALTHWLEKIYIPAKF